MVVVIFLVLAMIAKTLTILLKVLVAETWMSASSEVMGLGVVEAWMILWFGSVEVGVVWVGDMVFDP